MKKALSNLCLLVMCLLCASTVIADTHTSPVEETILPNYLCDASCLLTITFPDGGSITAVEPMTIVFGEGGFINDGAVVTGYSLGKVLSLDAGEVLAFEAGGYFDIGVGGNIGVSNIVIDTTGVITLEAIGGSTTVTIYNATITGGTIVLNSNVIIVNLLSYQNELSVSGNLFLKNNATLDIGTYATVLGTLYSGWAGAGETNNWNVASSAIIDSEVLTATGALTLTTGSIDTNDLTLTVPSGGSLTLINNSNITVSAASNLINWNAFDVSINETTQFIQPSISAAVFNRINGVAPSVEFSTLLNNGQVFLIGANGLPVTGDITLIGDNPLINGLSPIRFATTDITTVKNNILIVTDAGVLADVTLTKTDLNELSDLSQLVGINLIASDGNQCTAINATQCQSDDGGFYVLANGELILSVGDNGDLFLVDAGGALNGGLMFFVSMLLIGFRRKAVTH